MIKILSGLKSEGCWVERNKFKNFNQITNFLKMEKKIKNTLIFTGMTLVLIFGMIGLVYADEGKCPELSNYVNHTYFIHDEKENNFVEFDILVDKQSGYLFCWDDVSENNTEFMKFLKDKFEIVLVAENVALNKKGNEINFTFDVKNNVTIKRSPEELVRYEFENVKNNNVATVTISFKLNKTKNEVTLEEITNGIDILKHIIEKDKNKNILREQILIEGSRDKYISREENSKINVYLKNILVPIYVYIDKPYIQQMFVINLVQKDNNGGYFDHVRINLKDTVVSEIYLNRPGIHTLLIPTDAHYYREDISDLCMPQNSYPFSWDDISENNAEFTKFLKDELKINLAENAKVKKSDNEINVSDGENSLTLNKKENDVTLKIAGGETYKYILKEEKGKMNLYLYPCNALSHPCSKSDRILKHIKVISKNRHYGIIYKFIGLKNINESISYLEKSITTGNFTEEYNWKLFLLSNSSALKFTDEHTKEVIENATETTKKFTSAVVVEGTVYDKDANPVKGAEVRVYIVGIEANVIHIATITDEEGKFKIYHKPAGQDIYRLPKIEASNPNDKFNDKLYYGVVYSGLADSVDMKASPKKYSEGKDVSFPVVETLIIALIIGGLLVLFGIGYLTKIMDVLKGSKKEDVHGKGH